MVTVSLVFTYRLPPNPAEERWKQALLSESSSKLFHLLSPQWKGASHWSFKLFYMWDSQFLTSSTDSAANWDELVCKCFSCLSEVSVWIYRWLQHEQRVLGLFEREALVDERSAHPQLASPPPQARSHQQHAEKHWKHTQFPLLQTHDILFPGPSPTPQLVYTTFSI